MPRGRLRCFTPAGAPPTQGYSQVAVTEAGRLAFVSGQVGVDRDWVPAPTLAEQTERAFANLGQVLGAVGGTPADVVKLTIFAVGDADLATYCRVRDAFFAGSGDPPASSFVRVAGLYVPEALIEIEAIAILPPPDAAA